MEWSNLVQSNPEKAKAVIAKLKPYLPESNADEIPRSAKNKSIKKMDETIKPRRDLAKLK